MTKSSVTYKNTKTKISIKLEEDTNSDEISITLKYYRLERCAFTLTRKQVNTLARGALSIALDDETFYEEVQQIMEHMKTNKEEQKC